MHIALGDFDQTQRRHLEAHHRAQAPSGYILEEAA